MQPAHAQPAEFICLPISPWSERVKFALKLAQVPVTTVVYSPMVDEPWLHYKLGAMPWEKVSVPVLLTPERVAIRGSIPIAAWLASVSSNALVLGDGDTLRKVEAAADKCLEAARYLGLCRMIDSGHVDLEALPAPVRALPTWLAAKASMFIYKMLRYKYSRPEWTDAARANCDKRQGLLELRELLKAGGGKHFSSNQITMCDVVAASALLVIQPPEHEHLAVLLRARRRKDPNDPYVLEFGDLIAWAQDLYTRHR
jgi:glutathione S-transferase